MSVGVAESLLALCFGNLDAIDSHDPLGHSPQEKLDDLKKWVLVDLLVSRFPDVGRPTLRFEVQRLTDECKGDPLELLHSTTVRHGTSSDWSHRFPLSVFVEHNPAKQEVGFDIADCHLHSGASIPLPVFFSALASTANPVDKAQLADKALISSGGIVWNLGILLAATRWALWWLRWVRAGGDVHHVKSYVDEGFHEDVVPTVLNGTYWECVRRAATNQQAGDPFPDNLDSGFTFDGLCNIQRIFWRVLSSPAHDFPGRHPFFLGLARACVGISSLLNARPGDGLSRFVDRFDEMGLTRDAALGELRNELLVPTLRHVAMSDDVVGAEFRKTVTGKSRMDFKKKIRGALSAHHSAFAKFVQGNGNRMALSMPVGFLRRPLSDAGDDWTDLLQLREACYGVEALKQILRDDDGTIAKAIWATDVAGDEFGSASWPFAAAAELMRRQGIDLEYAIHAGEAFTSPLNGIRRIGELYLADRFPDRIGHALALSPTASAAVCSGETPPPIRIGDAICDLAWAWEQGCGSEVEARGLMSRLVADASGHGLPPEAWREAYKLLFSVDALIEHEVIVKVVSEYSAGRRETLEAIAGRHESDLVRALTALVCGAGPEMAYVDVKAPVPPALREPLANFDRTAAPAARTLVTDLVRTHSVIEVCPSSNLRLANLGGLEDHPVWKWKEEGIDVVVGSDDPLIFGATIADEFSEMLNVKNRATVMQIAEDGVNLCSGKKRRKLSEFETVAHRTG